jgi:gas vesicle protein
MKKIVIGFVLSFIVVGSFAAPATAPKSTEKIATATKETNTFNDLIKSKKRELFLRNYINDYPHLKEVIGNKKCNEVTKYVKIGDNPVAMQIQVSCKNIPDDFHISMTKATNSVPKIISCKEAEKRYRPNLRCKNKL